MHNAKDDHRLVWIMSRCDSCREMITTYDGPKLLLLRNNLIRDLWTAHSYKNHHLA